MNKTNTKNSAILLLTALIWGVAFVAQSEGGKSIGPYTFNCVRSLLGSVVLLPVILLLDKLNLTKKLTSPTDKKYLLVGGLLCGTILFLASNLQQLGLYLGASAGKAGFLTTCYILIVPILSLFLKKKCGLNVWIGVFLTLIGLYLLCIKDSFSIQTADLLLLLCAVIFAVHILVIDYFAPKTDCVRMSCIQFLVCGIFTTIPSFIIEMNCSFHSIVNCAKQFNTLNVWIPILYAGILSCGAAYTLQIIGQKNFNPTIASLLLSLESVFSVLAGFIILNEKMGLRELIGCILIFIAIILAQVPLFNKQ